MHGSSNPISLVSDGDIDGLLAATPGPVVVKATMNPCMPCELMRPVLHKLAAEFEGHMTVLEVDDNAEGFCHTWRIASFPQLLLFRDGQYVRRVMGYEDAGKLRQAVLEFLELDETEPSAAERAFGTAIARAEAALEETMAPAQEALAAHSDEIDRANREIQAKFADRKVGPDLTAEQLRAELMAEYKRAYATFADKVFANSQAQAAGVARYAEIMQSAVETFLQDSKR
ncbi:thioredoxin domain-containing protein [Reyranella sp.]|uniref:thioredoxin domain-containing protein n=1 Tax=Reyranella sp. TaxID=1929291 RepID=UPI0037844F98